MAETARKFYRDREVFVVGTNPINGCIVFTFRGGSVAQCKSQSLITERGQRQRVADQLAELGDEPDWDDCPRAEFDSTGIDSEHPIHVQRIG